jgi:hypothetical protein
LQFFCTIAADSVASFGGAAEELEHPARAAAIASIKIADLTGLSSCRERIKQGTRRDRAARRRRSDSPRATAAIARRVGGDGLGASLARRRGLCGFLRPM